MQTSTITIAIAVAALFSGCNTLERSRSLGNSAVSANVIAEQVCSNCHGKSGNAESPNFPNLAGQQAPYFVTQLNGFKSHGRSDPAGFEYMWGLSKHLTDEQIAGLADYYAKQGPRPTQVVIAHSPLISDGRKIYEEGVVSAGVPACAACHGAEAKGQAGFPRLAGQHSNYIVKQLMVFQRTDQRPDGGIMKGVAHSLTPQNMEAVAYYLELFPQK